MAWNDPPMLVKSDVSSPISVVVVVVLYFMSSSLHSGVHNIIIQQYPDGLQCVAYMYLMI